MKRLREKIFEPTYMLFGHWILLEVKVWIELPGTRLVAWYYELGGMKPGPRSFSRLLFTCDEWSRIRHHSPELLRMSVWRKVRKDWFDERSRENWLILIWPCIVFHGPLYTSRWENVWARKTWCPTCYGSFHLIKLFTHILCIYVP